MDDEKTRLIIVTPPFYKKIDFWMWFCFIGGAVLLFLSGVSV